MNFDEFTGEVQHRLELADTGETVRAIRATLMTLGQRVQTGDAEHLASTLPMEIGWYLTGPVPDDAERFDWREFVSRVAEIEQTDRPEAAYHAQVIMQLVSEVVPPADLRQLRAGLPEAEDAENWRKLFELVED